MENYTHQYTPIKRDRYAPLPPEQRRRFTRERFDVVVDFPQSPLRARRPDDFHSGKP